MDYAAELLAARGGTMTAEDLQAEFALLCRDCSGSGFYPVRGGGADRPCTHANLGQKIRQHMAAQGAEAATLREKVAALEARNERLWCEAWGGAVIIQASSADASRITRGAMETMDRMEREAEQLRAELARLKPSGQVAEDVAVVRAGLHRLVFTSECTDPEKDCRHNAALSRLAALAHEGVEARCHMPEVDGLTPYEKCVAGTCGHDDAGKPGHADRVQAESEAFNEVTGLSTATYGEAGGELREAHEEACDACADRTSDYLVLCDTCHQSDREKAAEAMRAACWEAVERRLEFHGLRHRKEDFRAVIAKAAP
jgi:hypothetical protein